jgi:hypothetical protein
VHPYSSRAFQWYQEHGKRHHGLGDLNMTNKTNKPPSFIDRFLSNKNVWFMKPILRE